jgi:hypothetical protein
MQRVFRAADGAQVAAKVQQDGFHRTGSGIDAK